MLDSISILGGFGKDSKPDSFSRIDLHMGDIICIVGPTGSGKTTFINDIELLANGSTISKRKILINKKNPPEYMKNNPKFHPVALITQHTTFLSDLSVKDFLEIHIKVRNFGVKVSSKLSETLEFANQLTGEPILLNYKMTELSGGQTRALLIADAVVIGNSPILLMDEIENAGIHRTKAIKLLSSYRKIFIFVTHDPFIALMSKYRIVMKNGRVVKIVPSDKEEKEAWEKLNRIDCFLNKIRESIRNGSKIYLKEMGGIE
ncbi:MAG: ATP-binding cassette domain-containing protein [Thermoanaerobaculia bacterium]